jgi:hypothetical protein
MPHSEPFNPGQLIRLKSQPDKCGAVIAINSTGPEIQYTVLLDGKPRSFFASQLVAADLEPVVSETLSANQCRAMLTARYIKHPGTSTLYSLNAARVNFIAYQFRPVIRFIRADRPRLLIADGVGVGKTIEAGLILRELQARQEVNSVMIICPRPLITEKKWWNEMKRFDQNFDFGFLGHGSLLLARCVGRSLSLRILLPVVKGARGLNFQPRTALIGLSLTDERLSIIP